MINPDERTKIIEKALKLRELSIRGIDGEKETAQRMFDTWKSKHNITDEELDSIEIQESVKYRYMDMTVEDFLKEMEYDIRTFGFSVIIYSLGKIFKNEDVADAGMSLFKESVKQRKEREKNNEKKN